MKVKLRELNGSYYLLINKVIRETLDFDKEVDVKIKNDKIIIQPVKKEKE